MNETIRWEEDLRGGQTWSQVLDLGMALRFTDLHGGANVSCLFYNAQEPSERYNMPDTLKALFIGVIPSLLQRLIPEPTASSVPLRDSIDRSESPRLIPSDESIKCL